MLTSSTSARGRKRKTASRHSPSSSPVETSSSSSSAASLSGSGSSSATIDRETLIKSLTSALLQKQKDAQAAGLAVAGVGVGIESVVQSLAEVVAPQKSDNFKKTASWRNSDYEELLVNTCIKYQATIKQRKGYEMQLLWGVITEEMRHEIPDLPFTKEQIKNKWKNIFKNYAKDVFRLAHNPNSQPASAHYEKLHPHWKDDPFIKKAALSSVGTPNGRKRPKHNEQIDKKNGNRQEELLEDDDLEEDEDEDVEAKDQKLERKVDERESVLNNLSSTAQENVVSDHDVTKFTLTRKPSAFPSSSSSSSSTRSPVSAKTSDRVYDCLLELRSDVQSLVSLIKKSVFASKENTAVKREEIQMLKEREKREREKQEIEIEIRKIELQKMKMQLAGMHRLLPQDNSTAAVDESIGDNVNL